MNYKIIFSHCGYLFFLLTICLNSHAAIIVGQPVGNVLITASPINGYTYEVPESYPLYSFTAMGGVSSEFQWQQGSLDDYIEWSYLGEPQNFNQSSTVHYYYGFRLNGSALTHETKEIGALGSNECTQDGEVGYGYPDPLGQSGSFTFLCDTEEFSKIDLSMSDMLPVGHYILQLIHKVVWDTSEILAIDSELIEFDVVAVPMNEPSIFILLGVGLAGLGLTRRRKLRLS
ncbi:MAG: PEP-CTERM sorting domain-containing protein [Gammaproteobacteria bacterium]|nr:PEP-CTERM sorting domain-containing protein [Gammaproteobacteria bacterium]